MGSRITLRGDRTGQLSGERGIVPEEVVPKSATEIALPPFSSAYTPKLIASSNLTTEPLSRS
ncbi:MAG: hypothetical protein WBV80_26490 [Mycobacterium sp.]